MASENIIPFTQADLDRALEIFEKKYPEAFALYVNQIQNPPEESLESLLSGIPESPSDAPIVHFVVREGINYGLVGTYMFMGAIGAALNDRFGKKGA